MEKKMEEAEPQGLVDPKTAAAEQDEVTDEELNNLVTFLKAGGDTRLQLLGGRRELDATLSRKLTNKDKMKTILYHLSNDALVDYLQENQGATELVKTEATKEYRWAITPPPQLDGNAD